MKYRISCKQGQADGSAPDKEEIVELCVDYPTPQEAIRACVNGIEDWIMEATSDGGAMAIDPDTSQNYERFYEAEPVPRVCLRDDRHENAHG